MSKLVAVDVAILPPADVAARVIGYSAALPAEGSRGLRLDAEHIPHITLTQQFVREEELDAASARIDACVEDLVPLRLTATGAGQSGHTLWVAIENTPELMGLHERLMEELRGFERPDGGPHAFFNGEGRIGDVLWVTGYRLKASFGHFTPHITLGHGTEPPPIEPFTFDAATVAACHLGRFCSCRRVLRAWTLPVSR
jgi:2'-5' RNA ligase